MTFPWTTETLPSPSDPDRTALGVQRWRALSEETEDPELAAFAAETLSDPAGIGVLEAVFGNSPFLSRSLLKEPDILFKAATIGFDACLDSVLAEIVAAPRRDEATNTVMTRLRRVKRRAGLLIALADITRCWTLPHVVAAISRLAEMTLEHALAQALADTARLRRLTLPNPEDPLKDSGLFVIGMGKLGARELNYSSDVDVIVLYDHERIDYVSDDRMQQVFVRLTRDFVRLMEESTADGYVFRTDLRLRPDPGSTPLAMSSLAAEVYYESLGQNWERAAMIKARIVAGDKAAGERFLANLRPFVWRKHLDFLAIQDIHSIKRQINAHKGGWEIAVHGHNVKLGKGGIREIEFFAQTQQLIWGGREACLRAASTRDALDALRDFGLIKTDVRDAMKDSYDYLRTVEHRLQMIEDFQTQTLPDTDEGLTHLALFLGHKDLNDFTQCLTEHLKRVQDTYAALFEDEEELVEADGNLVFTGSDDDPETLKTLQAYGFLEPATVSATVRGWHHGRYRATRSRRAREILTELMPTLLKALGNTANPDMAFRSFDDFLSQLPAGVQLFSLFKTEPELLKLLAEIAGTAPRLASHLGKNASVLDFVLCKEFYEPDQPVETLKAELDEKLDQGRDVQDWLDISRRWANDHKFRVGVLTIRDHMTPHEVGRSLTAIADAAITALFPRIEAEFAEKHGAIPGSGMAVLAMGKHGGRELSAISDLDLIFVYDVPDGVSQSDGPKPLAPGLYFARLSQRFINALTAPTGEGFLYEVDMRLRPSGSDGPIATRFDTFETYQLEQAWTWEHMALTRLRPVYGPTKLVAKIIDVARTVIRSDRDTDKLVTDIAEMRERIAKEHPGKHPFEVKHRPGGLVDLEFTAQFLQLRHGKTHPEILSPTTRAVFKNAVTVGLLDAEEGAALADAASFWLAVQATKRLTVEGKVLDDTLSDDVKRILARAGKTEDYDELQAKTERTAELVRAAFTRLILKPAHAAWVVEVGSPSKATEGGGEVVQLDQFRK